MSRDQLVVGRDSVRNQLVEDLFVAGLVDGVNYDVGNQRKDTQVQWLVVSEAHWVRLTGRSL